MVEQIAPSIDTPSPYSPPWTAIQPVQPVIVYVEQTLPPNFGCWKTAFLTILIFQTIGVTGLTLMFSNPFNHRDVYNELATLMVCLTICFSMTHVIVGWVAAIKQSTTFLTLYLIFSLFMFMFIFISRILYVEHQEANTSGPNTLFNLLSIMITLGYMKKMKDHRLIVSQSQAQGRPELAMCNGVVSELVE